MSLLVLFLFMISYEKIGDAWCIANKFLFGNEQNHDYINLALHKGTAMRYSKDMDTVVDFPGEYDIQENSIICYESGDCLHYQLIVDEQVIVLIQDPALLEKETLGEVDVWICSTQKCKEAVERDELEGEIIVLEEVSMPN